ncbi:hypothetical protein DTL21_27820 [Bremerella cremea]|uniref:Uncharacterized protein n=2 Tax=Pirellulales TaxID=2691354 RepID=A0A2S8FCI2_9BACT|nr:hypothetical protein C5Y83_27775 [Blastopirellula marina]RCS43144.1 hypothetical protein DTL21_27820 [Bremerella cremea]
MGGKDFGFKHGQHLAFAPLVDENADRNRQENGNGSADFASNREEFKQTPLANMFVSVANAMGVETASFADSTGTLTGLI